MSGRRSFLATCPSVAASIKRQRSSGTLRIPCSHWLAVGGLTPAIFATAFVPPRSVHALRIPLVSMPHYKARPNVCQ